VGVHPELILAHRCSQAGFEIYSGGWYSIANFRARLVSLKFQEETEMPDVHISWLAGRTVDQKRKVVEGITKVLMEEAGAKPESTHIVFVDIPHTDFASGGMLVADKNKKA
jgi:4-oxalocrotonate tautomerase